MLRITVSLLTLMFLPTGLSAKSSGTPFYEVKYSSEARPAEDLQRAVTMAKKSGQYILLDVGGEWCVWCHRLDSFFETNGDVSSFLLANFIPLKINMSPENRNESFLSQFPKISSYPHIFVLDSKGRLLHSQDTGELEEGKGHSHDKVLAFLKKWAPKKLAK